MFPTPHRSISMMNKPKLVPASPGVKAPAVGYCLDGTWMTGLGNTAGLYRVDRVDEGTIAVSGELDKKCVVAVKDLKGDTLSVINMGSNQVRGLCVLDLHNRTVVVVTRERRVELWDPLTRKLLSSLRIKDFYPCVICRTAWDTFLVANWSQNHPNFNKNQPSTKMLEMQATTTTLKLLDHRLTVALSSVISMDKSHKILVMASFNNDVIMAVDYISGDVIWKIVERDYEGLRIRPHAICCEGDGYIYVADTGLPYCRIFLLSHTGEIINKILNTAGWCDDIAWINEIGKLVVLHDKSGLEKQDISIYTINQLPKPNMVELDII